MRGIHQARDRRKVFICYRREDSSGDTRHLYEKLTKSFRKDQIFRDQAAIKPGEDFAGVIDNAIATSDVLIAVIGKHWLDSTEDDHRRLDDPIDPVRREIASGLKHQVRIIPVLVQEAAMPTAEELPEEIRALARRNAVKISDERWDYDIQRLIAALEESGIERSDSVVTLRGKARKVVILSAMSLAIVVGAVMVKDAARKAAEDSQPDIAITPESVSNDNQQTPIDTDAAAERDSTTTTFSALVPVPQNINTDLTPAMRGTLMEVMGAPGLLTESCSKPTNPQVTRHVVTENVGPFSVTGLKPAVDALRRIFTRVRQHSPELYDQLDLGRIGMLCVRKVRGSSSFSMHSWGTAIDIQVGDELDKMDDQKTQLGLLHLYPFFKQEKFIWGAGFRMEESMHFEASDELIREWEAQGKFATLPDKSKADEPLPNKIPPRWDIGFDIHFAHIDSELTEKARQDLLDYIKLLDKGGDNLFITIEGHTSTPGKNERNLSLGERRAAQVKDFLAKHGFDLTQVRTISYGEEIPICEEDSTECNKRNDRVHITATSRAKLSEP